MRGMSAYELASVGVGPGLDQFPRGRRWLTPLGWLSCCVPNKRDSTKAANLALQTFPMTSLPFQRVAAGDPTGTWKIDDSNASGPDFCCFFGQV